MSDWNHLICDRCWGEHSPNRTPVRLLDAEPEHCCFCGQVTRSGIYVRADPTTLRCRGLHPGTGPAPGREH